MVFVSENVRRVDPAGNNLFTRSTYTHTHIHDSYPTREREREKNIQNVCQDLARPQRAVFLIDIILNNILIYLQFNFLINWKVRKIFYALRNILPSNKVITITYRCKSLLWIIPQIIGLSELRLTKVLIDIRDTFHSWF